MMTMIMVAARPCVKHPPDGPQGPFGNGPNAKPAWAAAAGWEHVERGVFAAAITNCKRLLEQTSVGLDRGAGENKQAIVHAQGHAKVNFAELFGFLAGAKVQAVEVKDD